MILTPLDDRALSRALERLAGGLAAPADRAALARIARSGALRARGEVARAHRAAALRLARGFGMASRAGAPRLDFGWDGSRLRRGTEAYVLLHEVAHFQLAAPVRRWRPEFGLGPGSETGRRAAARRAAALVGLAADREEAMASLLGILWEVELGQPALASFLDQNWLEGIERPAAAAHFARTLGRLRRGGFVRGPGRPTRCLRRAPDRS